MTQDKTTARLQAMDAVLGSMLIDSSCVGVIMELVSAEDFTEPTRKMVYCAIQSLFEQGKAIDPVTVLAELGKQELYDFVAQLIQITPTAANALHYARLVKQQSMLLKLQQLGTALAEADSADAAEDVLSRAHDVLSGRAQQTTSTMTELLSSFYDRHNPKREAVYLDWPLEDLQREIYAEPGDMIVIGGYPSDGKTSLALWFAAHMAKTQRVGFFSYETSRDKLFDRLVAMTAKVEMPALKHNSLSAKDWDTLAYKSSRLTALQLEIVEANGLTVAQIRAKALARKYDVVFIDYLQKIRPSGSAKNASNFEQVSEISSALQNFGRQTNIPVIALSQLSRPEKNKKTGLTSPPSLTSLRQSGQIEQDADVVMLIYRERQKEQNSRRVLSVAKNKEGETNFGLFLGFDGSTQTFSKSYVQAAAPVGGVNNFRPSNAPIPPQFYQTTIGEE